MARSTRRFFVPAALALFIALFTADRLAAPVHVQAVFDPAGPAFDPLSTFDISATPEPVPYPPRILAGTNSHGLPANAATRNGYCIDVNLDGITPVVSPEIPAGAFGFRLVATNPVTANPPLPPTAVVPIPGSGTYVVGGAVVGAGAASLNAASGSTADDVYCVVATAPAGYTRLVIEWHYNDGANTLIKSLTLDVVNLALKKIGDGLIGGPAEVCTVGWDEAFLTGAASNAMPTPDPNPDPLNLFDTATPPSLVPPGPDFTIQNGSPNAFIAYQRQDKTEWCAGIGSTVPETGLGVTLNLHAVYNRVAIGARSRNFDDQPVSVQLPADQAVDVVNSVELRHITLDGQISQSKKSDPKVIHSVHYICVIGTDATAGDALAANGIVFNPQSPPDLPSVSGLSIFTKTAGDAPRLQGVVNNTICFRYTSTEPGEHSVYVNYTDGGVPAMATFDTNNDGNGQQDGPSGALITAWNVIDRTVISTGAHTSGAVTFTEIDIPLTFNLADGTFLGNTTLNEWVLGKHTTGGVLRADQLLDGVLIRAEIVGSCGFFVTPDFEDFGTQTKVITGISIGGRFELNDFTGDPYGDGPNAWGDDDASPDNIQISTQNAGGCGANVTTRLRINVYYPGLTVNPAAEEEWVDLRYTFRPAQKIPRVAWAGQYVTITYAVSSDTSCIDSTVHFVRPKGQPGTFIADNGITLLGPDHATTGFGDACSATVRYESEDQGEVDIEVFVEGGPIATNVSKQAFPIFFLVFEDITIEATPDQFVSSFGDVSAQVRGYFVGSNPSGRPSEVKPDGRTVPADRWVLPNDWELLKGQSNLRSVLGSLDMPSAIVTFFMENEGVVNNYKAGVRNGASGFMIPDDPTDFSFNVNPHTKVTTQLGSVAKPRMMSQPTEQGGEASIDTFGDKNLSYEGCVANVITKNPHCKPEDIAGRTRYYAVVEYPEAANRGKHPAVASNVAETVWRWAGFKDVTIVNTDSPQMKYVVAHLRDRDGFCDAANFNNTLGVPVTFEIDAGGGAIIEAADQPYSINGTRRFATATTFDTTNLLGAPVNTHIAKPPLIADQPDECQAWIKITNSLLIPTNVTVKFPAPPSPIPGEIRITDLKCDGTEFITVKNVGNNLVNLAGFGLESPKSDDTGNAQQLDLIGLLQPGESKTFQGGPGAEALGWLDGGSEILSSGNDFVSVTWEDYPISTAFCDGRRVENPINVTFPPDGEGEIWLDIVIPFGAEVEVPLSAGWNLVPTGEGTTKVDTAFGAFKDKVTAIYIWDPVLGEWTHYIPDAPAGVNTVDTIGNGVFMWVLVKEPFTVTLPK